MPLEEEKPEPQLNTYDLELTGKASDGSLLVKHRQTGNMCSIADTFAEM